MKLRIRALVLASAAIAAVTMAAIPASAASSTKLNVPFSFTVNGRTLPAGEYTVVRNDIGNFVRLQSKDASQGYTWLALSNGTDTDRVTLKFDASDQHVLQSIQYGALVTPRIDGKPQKAEQVSPETGMGQ